MIFKKRVIPTVFAHNKKEFYERFEKLRRISRTLQIDFMDGKFVKARSVELKEIPDLDDYWGKFEAHLMVKNPEKYIDRLKEKGFDKIIFHIEAVKDKEIIGLIWEIKNKRVEAWIAVNPATKIEKIKEFLGEIDGILIMGVYPGKEHQKFISSVYENIKKLRGIDRKVPIQVDGGVNLDVAEKLGKLGVDYINSGAFVAESENPRRVIKLLNKALYNGNKNNRSC